MCIRDSTKWVTALAWQPAHLAFPSTRVASASKDGTARVWCIDTRRQLLCLGGHAATVNAIKWTGANTIITGASDKEIRVWNGDDGRTIRVLVGHAHWVNSLALSSDHALRTGACDHRGNQPSDAVEARAV